MNALRFLPVLLMSAMAMFGQMPDGEYDPAKWNNPDYLQARALAENYVAKIEARDFVGAEEMLPALEFPPKTTKAEKRRAHQARADMLQKTYDKHFQFGECVKKDLVAMKKGTLPDYPDSVTFYSIVLGRGYQQKSDGPGFGVFVKSENGVMSIHGY